MGSATTFASLIANPASEKVFLAEIKVAEEVTNFTLTGGGSGSSITTEAGDQLITEAGDSLIIEGSSYSYTYQFSYLNETITLADSKTETIRKSVVALELDGTALTARATLALVEANAGSYWHDTANSLLYIHPTDNGSPNHHTVVVYFWLYLATKGIVLNSIYYEPYISERGIPSLNQEIQSVHWGVVKISSGNLELLNGRGFFDQIANKWFWANKTIKILLGGDSLAYSEYTVIFTGKIIETVFTRNFFRLEIGSKGFDLLRSVPFNNFWTSTYANLDPAAEGRAIPMYYGVYSAAQAPIVTCINTSYAANTYQFKICDTTYRDIYAITQVYVDLGDGTGWQTIAHANEDLDNATFTITSASFVLGISRVKVAFSGYTTGGGISGLTFLSKGVNIVWDLLLTWCGYSVADLDPLSWVDEGANLNVAIESETEAITVIEDICKSDLAFFDENAEGLLRYRIWEPTATGTIPVLADKDFLESLPPEFTQDTTEIYWKVKVGYSWLGESGYHLYTESSNSRAQYCFKRDNYLTYPTYLRAKSDADILAQRLNLIMSEPVPIIKFALKASQVSKTMGDKIKITLARAPFSTAGGYDERLFEIIERNLSAFPFSISYKARDLMDYGANVGFWMGSSAPDWSAATRQEREDSGFWCDSSGYADPSDSSSLNKSLWW